VKRRRIVIELDINQKDPFDFRRVESMIGNSLDGHPNLKFRRVKVMALSAIIGAEVRKSQDKRRMTKLIEWITSFRKAAPNA
jgi:hypothetical protein